MERSGLSSLAVFVAVATRGGFRPAARELGLSPSAVSHAVAALERRLGVRLLSRTTRSVAATEAGRRLLAQVAPALGEIDQALEAAGEARDRPSGRLKITAPRSLVHVLMPRVASFLQAYPEVIVELGGEDALVDIVASGADAGIRLGESLQKDMIAVRVGGPQRMACLAAPAILAGRSLPRHPREVVDFPCIATRLSAGAFLRWEFDKGGDHVEIAVEARIIVNESRALIEAVKAGLGLGYTLEEAAAEGLGEGTLVRLFADWCPPFPGFHLYHPSRHQMRPALRAFIDHLAAAG